MVKLLEWTGLYLRLLDQTRLPGEAAFVNIADERQMWEAIRREVVSGAPQIGTAAAFGAFLGVRDFEGNLPALRVRLKEVCGYLATSRPTAANLFWALERIQRAALDPEVTDGDKLKERLLYECMVVIVQDRETCQAIGKHGWELLKAMRGTIGILTDCSAGIGTPLAPLDAADGRPWLREPFRIYATETRKLLQGGPTIAEELQWSFRPVTAISDNMAGTIMREKKVQVALVGADHIAANGDTANKIGTHGLAALARRFGIPFYVVAPTSTVDLSIPDGSHIPIDQHDLREVIHRFGLQTAPEGVDTYNPALDVTPAELISAIVTEKGILTPPFGRGLREACAQ